MACIFCDIVSKKTETEIVMEDEDFVAFYDIHPKAPVHVLVIPKKHIASLQNATKNDTELLGKFLLAAQKVAQEKQLQGYKLQMNVGKEGGQEIDHIHVHLLAG